MTTAQPVRMPPLTLTGWLRWDVVGRALDTLAPQSVLEFGCGQGAAGARIAARTSRYVGVELDPESAAVATHRIEPLGGTVLVGDDTAVPEGSEFDLVCAFEVLEHIEDDAGALASWRRFIRPGGHLLLSVPAHPERFGPTDELVGHFRRYAERDLRQLLEKCGFGDVRTSFYGWPIGYAVESGRDVLTRRSRAGADSMAERTATSGRFRQPKEGSPVASALEMATWPFRRIQRLTSRHGTGLIVVAERPADPGEATGSR